MTYLLLQFKKLYHISLADTIECQQKGIINEFINRIATGILLPNAFIETTFNSIFSSSVSVNFKLTIISVVVIYVNYCFKASCIVSRSSINLHKECLGTQTISLFIIRITIIGTGVK